MAARLRSHSGESSKQKTRALWTGRHGMQTLIALLVAAAAACAIARPPGPTAAPATLQAQTGPLRVRAPLPPTREYLSEYLLPRFLLPHYLGYEESPRVLPPIPDNDWLNKEIYRINQMEEEENLMNPYEMDLSQWITQDTYMQRIFDGTNSMQRPIEYAPQIIRPNYEDTKPLSEMTSMQILPKLDKPPQETKRLADVWHYGENYEQKKKFALTPMDKGYFELDFRQQKSPVGISESVPIGDEPKSAMIIEPPRQIRQNPNLSKQKHLLGPELGKLKTGLSHESEDATDRPRHIHVLESSASDPADSIYGIALIAAIGAALTMAIFGFAFGWYTLSKKAKAAADVDYPAYGVTGPTIDTSGDRKLAHSAHMYHYQHQKQQIIAMERNGLEQRTGSVSDPESEEENEEGDYTVYECPGFATTGEMEVKNPLFSEDPTPATPGKCEVVKPQPKD